MILSKRIKQLRIEKGITQEKLAEYLNISFQAVSKWENGTSSPDINLLPKLSTFFGVTIDDLFTMNTETHLERIENMLETQDYISIQDETYIKNYLLGIIENDDLKGKAYQLLSELSSHRAKSYYQDAKAYAKEALKVIPNDKMSHVLLVEASNGVVCDWNEANHHELINFYQAFTEENPTLRRGHLFLADHLIADGRLDEARDVVEKIKNLKDDYLIHWYQGLILKAEGHVEEAEKSFDRMIEDEPDNWITWSVRADELTKMFKYDKAIEYNLKAYELQPSPKYVDSPICNALIYEQLGNYNQAIKMNEIILKTLKDDWKITFGKYVEKYQNEIFRLKSLGQ